VPPKFLTVRDAAEQLGLHPKTVLRYVSDGRLPATRVGKSYRITQSQLRAFAGDDQPSPGGHSTPQATCIVDIQSMSANRAGRLASFLQAAATAARDESPPLHVHTAFDPAAGSLKVVIFGGPRGSARMLELLDAQIMAGE